MTEKNKGSTKSDEFTIIAEAICKYLKENGWNVLVIGAGQIRHQPGQFKYNCELVFPFTGAEIESFKGD